MTARHVLVTGHTGFKGAWLVMYLRERGHKVSGIALEPTPGALFTRVGVSELLAHDIRLDIRDASAVNRAVNEVKPDVVVHMAAQALVRESYRDPVPTIETNVSGTMNVLEAVRQVDSVAAQLIVTTDKVYRNVDRVEGYREEEPLGAADPYSTSKAMADLLTQAWVRSFESPPTAILRGGNVIGGGDNAADRLLPDLVRAFARGERAVLRYPDAVRPWQHVLDCIDGYWTVAEALLSGTGAGEWNVGPGPESLITTGAVADHAAAAWGAGAGWDHDASPQPHEAHLLALDPSKIERELGWSSRLRYPTSVDWTIEWELRVRAGEAPRDVSLDQVSRYLGGPL